MAIKHFVTLGRVIYDMCYVSAVSVALYFVHKIAFKYSTGKGWAQGFLIHVSAYYVLLIVHAAVGWSHMKLIGHHAVFAQFY